MKNLIVAMMFSFVLIFGSIGIAFSVGLTIHYMTIKELVLIILITILNGLWFNELTKHQSTKKELAKLKEQSIEKESQ